MVGVLRFTADGWARFLWWYGPNITGVMRPPSTGGAIVVSHCVSVVGWGVDATGAGYWLIQNSFGPVWGEGGYARLARGCAWGVECGAASVWYATTVRSLPAPAPTPGPTPGPTPVPVIDSGRVVALTVCLVVLLSAAFVAVYRPVDI